MAQNEFWKTGSTPVETSADGEWWKSGSKPVEKTPTGYGLKDFAGDAASILTKGVIGVGESLVGFANLPTFGYAGKALEDAGVRFKDASQIADSWKSDQLKAQQQEISDAEGVTGKLAAAVRNPGAVGAVIGESLPSMFAGGAVAKGIGLAGGALAKAAPFIGEGAVGAGQMAEQVRQDNADGLLTPTQAALSAASGVATGGLAAAGGRAAKALGVGDLDQMIASGASQGMAREGLGVASRAARGAVSEGLIEELPQSLSEQAFQNAAQDKPLTQGMDEAAVMGALSGGLMGGAAGALSRPSQQMGIDPNAGPLSRAAAASVDSAPAPQLGFSPLAGTPIIYPDGSVALNSEQEFQKRNPKPQPADKKPVTAPLGNSLTGTPASAMLGASVDPLAQQLGANREIEAVSASNVDRAGALRAPMPATEAANMLVSARDRGMDFTVAKHPSGGFVVVPREWVTPEIASASMADLKDTLSRVAKAEESPVVRAKRTKTEAADLTLNADPVSGYVDNLRKVNTPAAKLFVRDFDAGRITRQDVEKRMAVERGKTADERLAEAAAQAKATKDPRILELPTKQEPSLEPQAVKPVQASQEKPQAPAAAPAVLGQALTDTGTNMLGRGADPLQSIIQGQNNAAQAKANTPVAQTPEASTQTQGSTGNGAVAEQAGGTSPVTPAPKSNKLKEARNARRNPDVLRGTSDASSGAGPDIANTGMANDVGSPDGATRAAAPVVPESGQPSLGQQPAADQAALRPDNWRGNAIKAGKVARTLGLDPKGKRLKEIVAEIDAVDAGSGVAAKPAGSVGFTEAFDSLKDGGITADFFNKAFGALKAGKQTISGVKDPVLSRAKQAFDAGLINTPEDIARFERDGYPKFVAKANVQNTPSSAAGTEAKASPVEARAPEGGNAASNTGVPAAPGAGDVQADGVKPKAKGPATAQQAIDAFNADDSTSAMEVVARLKLDELQKVGEAIGFRPQINENAKRYRERLAEVATKLTKTGREELREDRAVWDRMSLLASEWDRMERHTGAPEGSYDGKWMTHAELRPYLLAELAKLESSPFYEKNVEMVSKARPALFKAAQSQPKPEPQPEPSKDAGSVSQEGTEAPAEPAKPAQPKEDKPAEDEAALDDRDTFTFNRLNRETNEMELVTFKRGEYVRYTLSGKELFGDIDGISQAKREFSVEGLWYPMGYAYKAERPAKKEKPTEKLSTAIEKVNAKNGEGLTEADRVPEQTTVSKTPTLDKHTATIKAVREGSASVEDYQAAFSSMVADPAAIKAELNTLNKENLLRSGGLYFYQRYKSDSKAEVIEAIYGSLVDEYALGKDYGPTGYFMGEHKAHKIAKEKALRELVEGQTAETLAEFASEVKKAQEEFKAKREAKKAAMENPQTLEDFRAVMREHITDGKTRKEAFLMLTPEQRVKYDELEAETTKEARETRKRERKTEVRAADQSTGGQIIATKHTRSGYDLFVVQLSDRLSKEDYNTILASAKKLGGWYSSFRGNGAVPGFQFKEKPNAEAFLKLAAGDTTDAQTQAEQRRDAFEDDRSQTAVERLRTMADKLEEQASEIEGADRKTNTARRARFASRALAGAAEMKAKAKTMRNVAQSIEDGKAKFLDGIRTKTQVDMLTGIVGTAKYNELAAKYPTYAEQEKRKGEPPTAETADFAEFPSFTAYRSDLASLARQMLEVEGTKKLGQQLMKIADDVSDAYIEFSKQPGNLAQLSTFSIRRGDEVKTAIFPSKDLAERAIKRSGLTGKAIVLAEKRGVNRIIMSPSEAINAGIWTGDGDKRITLTADAGNTLVETIGRRGNKRNGLAVPWQFQTAHDRLKALARMGIETPAEFRSALREFIGQKEQATSNKVRELELAMAGKKNDGLDFFPTPAEVADQMVEAADLTPEMDVLEPSGGMGHIADRIRDAGAEPDVVEMAEDRRELLTEKGYELVGRDFLDLSGKLYDRIVMNPPFSNRRDAEHVQHAYKLLKPGGRIVAIMGEGVFFGKDKKAQDFRDWLDSVGGTDEKLPAGSFMDPSLPVNTGVNARMVVIEKPAGDATTQDDGDAFMGDKAKSKRQGTPVDSAIMDMAGEGREANEILSFIANASKSPYRRQLAQRLLATGANPAVSLGGEMGGGAGFRFLAKYSRKNHEVTLSEAAADRAEQIFLHETAHSATLLALDKGGLFATQMNRLYESAKAQGAAEGQYGMKNVGEFVAEAFTNPEFQKALQGMKAESGSLWNRFVSMVRRLLGLSDRSQDMLSAVLETGAKVMRENMPLRAARSFRAEDGPAFSGEDSANFGISDAVEQINKQAAVKPVVQALNDTFNVRGKLHWWHKTVGTPFNLAERVPEFKRVFNAVQDFITSVSFYGAEAAAMAPKIIPKLESWRDLGKSPISAEDNKAIAAPIFEGTLSYTRDENGKPVQTDDIGRAGIIWTDAELRSKFGLTDAQIGLYREFRSATDKSLTNLALSDILQFAGKDAAPIKDVVMGMSLKEGSETVRDYLRSLAEGEDKTRKAILLDTSNSLMDRADKAQKLIDKGYAPLQRFGRHTIYAKDANGEQLFFGMYEDRWAAARAARQMREQYPGATVEVGMMSEQSYKMFQGISPETIELFGTMLGMDPNADGQQNEAFQTYLKLAKSNRSALKRLIHRKGISGYSEDASRVLAAFIYSNARQTASNLHVGEIMDGVVDIPRDMGDAKDAAVKLARYTMDPQEEAQAIRGLLFAQYLGGSIASAAINALQPAQVTFPYLSQFVGAKRSAALMAGAVRDSLKKSTGNAKLDAELKKAEEEGIVSPQEIFQLMAQAQGKATLKAGDGTNTGDAMAAASNTLSRLSLGWGKVFSIPEQFNRRTTFIAAYRTALESGKANPYEFAKQAVKETQLVYNKGNRPEWARGTVGALAFTFKTYSISYVELLQRMASNGPEGRRAAMLMIGVLMLMAGAGGLPGVEDAEDVIDGIAQRVFGLNFQSRQKRREWLADTFGEGGAQFIENGLSGLPWSPTDVSGRLGLGNLIPGTGLFVKKQDYTRDVTELAGPAADMTKRFLQGAGLLLQGEVLKAGEIVAPAAVRNMIQGGRMLTTGQYTDAKGRKVVDTTTGEALTKLVGFQPADVAKVQETTGITQQMISLNKIRESEIADKWAKGLAAGDPDQVQEARDELRKWNNANPESPIRIKMPQVLRRVKALKEDKASRIARTAPKEIRQDVRRELERQQ